MAKEHGDWRDPSQSGRKTIAVHERSLTRARQPGDLRPRVSPDKGWAGATSSLAHPAPLSWIAGSGTEGGLVYLGLPVASRRSSSRRGGEKYLVQARRAHDQGARLLRRILPTSHFDGRTAGFRMRLRFEIVPSALHCLRLGALADLLLRRSERDPPLALIGIVSWIVWIIAAIADPFTERCPEGLWRFQRGVVARQACLLGYLASLVATYPPFSFDTGPAATNGPRTVCHHHDGSAVRIPPPSRAPSRPSDRHLRSGTTDSRVGRVP